MLLFFGTTLANIVPVRSFSLPSTPPRSRSQCFVSHPSLHLHPKVQSTCCRILSQTLDTQLAASPLTRSATRVICSLTCGTIELQVNAAQGGVPLHFLTPLCPDAQVSHFFDGTTARMALQFDQKWSAVDLQVTNFPKLFARSPLVLPVVFWGGTLASVLFTPPPSPCTRLCSVVS